VILKRVTRQESEVKKKQTKDDTLLAMLALSVYLINSIEMNEF
jgi:hypothetical protein